MLIHFDGSYKGSTWVFFGLTSPSFYRSGEFSALLIRLIRSMTRQDLSAAAKAADQQSRADCLKLGSPTPRGFLRVSDDGKHIVYPDGRRFFMIGCNYIGPFDRKCYMGGDLFDVHRLEDDFIKARDAGVNILRFWLFGLEKDPAKVVAVRELARRYGIYLLLHLGPHATKSEEIVASVSAAARAFHDEPMVLGYDLMNEPYIGTVGAITHDGHKMPLLRGKPYDAFAGLFSKAWVDRCMAGRPEWPQMHRWLNEEDSRNLYAAYATWNRYAERIKLGGASTFPGLVDGLPADEKYRPFLRAVSDTFGEWIRFQVDAIRAVDKRHLITVGYNTALSCLPANGQLDFVSQHVYERPGLLAKVLENVTTLDRLRHVWPDKPITLGEFGYSNGIMTAKGRLDMQTSSVGEMIHYLYAMARGYDGCMKWSLTDWPVAVIRHNAPWIRGEGKQVYESGFGLYYIDGTIRCRPKPIAHALRFLRETVDAFGPSGEIQVKAGNTSIGTAYVFRASNALFIGDQSYETPEISFRTPVPTNVLVRWTPRAIHVMSTDDATVRLDPSAFVPSIHAAGAKITPDRPRVRVSGTSLALELLAGQTVRIE